MDALQIHGNYVPSHAPSGMVAFKNMTIEVLSTVDHAIDRLLDDSAKFLRFFSPSHPDKGVDSPSLYEELHYVPDHEEHEKHEREEENEDETEGPTKELQELWYSYFML